MVISVAVGAGRSTTRIALGVGAMALILPLTVGVLVPLSTGHEVMTESTAVGWRMFIDNPMFGVGSGNFQPSYQQYADALHLDTPGRPRLPQNVFVQLAAENGLLGLFTVLLFFGFIMRRLGDARQSFAHEDQRRLKSIAHALRAGFMGLGIFGAFVVAQGTEAFWAVIWLYAAIVLALPRVARHEHAWGHYNGDYLEYEH
jgi:hypothetical protein